MVQKIFSIYDAKAEAYMPPFFMATKGQAIRAWVDSISDSNTQFHKHPEDFTLFEIGQYNDQDASILAYETKIPLGTALELKKD